MTSRAATVALIALLSGAAASAATLPFSLDAAVSADQPEVILPVTPERSASIAIVRQTAPPAATVTAMLSPFLDPQGRPVRVDFVLPDKSLDVVSPPLTVDRVLRLTIRVPTTAPVAKLTGTLTLTSGATSSTWKVSLVPGEGRPAMLVADTNVFAIAAVRPLWDRGAELESFTDRIKDKTNVWPLENVSLRLEQLTKAGAGFDPERNLTFAMDKVPAPDFLTAKPATPRNVPARGQSSVRIGIRGLRAGEYAATLRFQAANSVDDDAQKLALNISVKDSPWRALFVLALAVLGSFVGTKLIAAMRQRVALRARITTLDGSWLRQEPATSAVVWAQAALRLSRDAAHHVDTLLGIPDVVNDRVSQVEKLLPLLRQIHDRRADLQNADYLGQFAMARGFGILGRLSTRLADPPVNDAVAQDVTTQLQTLQAWQPPTAWLGPYWADIQRALTPLLLEVRAEDIQDAAERQVIAGLKASLITASATPNPPADPLSVEYDYALLRILWERRSLPIFHELIQKRTAGLSRDELFKMADDEAWQRLKDAINSGIARIDVPSTGVQAYEPFPMTVKTGDTGLDNTFLVRYGLVWRWKISVRAANPIKRVIRTSELNPESLQPSIVQYSNGPGSLAIEVSVTRGTDTVTLTRGARMTVQRSETIGLIRSFGGVETAAFAVALLTAMVTGFGTFYAKNPTFGSMQDYLALVAWGLAIDLGKNIVQK